MIFYQNVIPALLLFFVYLQACQTEHLAFVVPPSLILRLWGLSQGVQLLYCCTLSSLVDVPEPEYDP